MKNLIYTILFCFIATASFSQETVINDSISNDSIYFHVDEFPEFPGGEEARMKFIHDNINYPEMAQESGIQGTVYVKFIIEKDGSISNVEIIRGIGGGCDEEAIRILRMMPKWKPAMSQGKPVRIKFNMPFKFTIMDGAVEKVFNNDSITKKARFPGNSVSMDIFIKENLKYPRKAKKEGKEGKVVISFEVGLFGDISNIKIVESLGEDFDKEAIRLIEKMPDWIPAEHKNNRVNVRVQIPIEFRL